MIRYILKRCRIAVAERKIILILALAGAVVYPVYTYLVPSEYIITSTVSFDFDDSEKIISMPSMSVWRQVNSLIGNENSFITRYATNIPEHLLKKIDDISSDTLAEPLGDNINRRPLNFQKPQLLVEKYLNLRADSIKRNYLFTYRGADQDLGSGLINFYSAKLIEHLFNNVNTRMESRVSGQGQKRKVVKKIRKGQDVHDVKDKVDLHRKTALLGHDIEVYKYILEHISTVKKSGPRIVSGVDNSVGMLVRRLIISGLVSIFILFIIIVLIEFNSKYLTSETQVARYLNVQIVGSIGRMKSISGGSED